MKNRMKKAGWLFTHRNGIRAGITTFLLPLLAACGADDNVPDMPLGDIPLDFGVSVDQAVSRAGESTTANLLSMGVYAYYTGGNNLTTSDKPNFMCNQKVERANNASPWTYSPVKYWPNNPADKVSFYAYGPYDVKGLNVSGATQSGPPTMEYTIQEAEADQADLIIASVLPNQTYANNNGKVSFKMFHALTRVDVNVTNVDKASGMQITSFSMSSLMDGKRTLPYNKSEEWNLLTGGGGIFTRSSCIPTHLPYTPAVDGTKTNLATFFVMPIRNGLGFKPRFSITYTTPGSASSGGAPVQTVKLSDYIPSPTTWIMGAHISYNFKIEKKKLTVTVSTHPTWDDAGTGTVTGSVVITYAVNPSDPNWGTGGTGSVNGVPVVTHSEAGDAHWEEGRTEIVTQP